MQGYGSLALRDNSEVGEDIFSAFAPARSSSQSMKPTHSSQLALLGEDLVISATCEVRAAGQLPEGPIAKGPGMVLGYIFMFSQPNLSAL